MGTVNLLLCPPKNVCVKKNYVKRQFFSDFQENPGVLAILSCYSKSAVVYHYGLLLLIEFPVKEKITYLVDFFPSNCQKYMIPN